MEKLHLGAMSSILWMFSIPECVLTSSAQTFALRICLSCQIKTLESGVINPLVEDFEAYWLGSPAVRLRAKCQDALLWITSTFHDISTSFNICQLNLYLWIPTPKVGIVGERAIIQGLV